MSQQKIILIAGPTASGKSALALDLAQKNNGVIINADAMQIYQGLPILSAQPGVSEQKSVPHRLYGALAATDVSSAGVWQGRAEAEIKHAVEAGHTPIVVGGTGLYFRALAGGLSDIPSIPKHIRDEAEGLYEKLGEPAFRQRLAELDPVTEARLARNDRQRLIRAYEVAIYTNHPISYWQTQKKASLLDGFQVEKHVLLPEREKLYAACDARFQKMIEFGVLDEVTHFLKQDLDPDLPVMKTLGLRELGAYLSGTYSLNEAITKAQQATRNYAKRQMTWFRNQGI